MPIQLWNKLIAIAPFGGVFALTRLPVGIIREYPATRACLLDVAREVFMVARARGVGLRQHHLDSWITSIERHVPPGTYGSMYHDLAAGRPLELEALNGAVVRLGQAVGVPPPWNSAVYAALQPYVHGTPVLP